MLTPDGICAAFATPPTLPVLLLSAQQCIDPLTTKTYNHTCALRFPR
jgi:hypothetical protein